MLSLRKSYTEMPSPDKGSLLLLSRKPIQLNSLSAWMRRYFLASLQNLGNCGLHGLHQSKGSSPPSRTGSFLFLQTIMHWKYWVCQSITCSTQRQVHLPPRYSHQTRWIPPVSFWAWRAALLLPSGSDSLWVLEYYFKEPSEYWFLVCRLHGDYPSEECHHYRHPSSVLQKIGWWRNVTNRQTDKNATPA